MKFVIIGFAFGWVLLSLALFALAVLAVHDGHPCGVP